MVKLMGSGFLLTLARFLRMVASFYALVFVPRLLDPTAYGLVAVLSSVSVFLSMADGGFGQALRSKMNELFVDQRRHEYFVAVFQILLVWSIVLSLLIGIAAGPTDAIRKLLAIPEERSDLATAALFALIGLLLNIPFSLNTLLAMAFQRYWLIVFWEVALSLIGVFSASVLFFVRRSDAPFVYIVSYHAGFLLLNVGVTLLFLRSRRWKLKGLSRPRRVWILRDVWPTARQYLLMGFTYAVIYFSDALIIAYVAPLEKAGDFRILMTLFQSALVLLQTLMSPFWDVAAIYKTQQRYRDVVRELKRYVIGAVMLSAVAMLTSPWVRPVLRFLTGRSLSWGTGDAFLAALWFSLGLFHYPFLLFLNGIGERRELLTVQVIMALSKWPLCYFLGRSWGITGILVGTDLILLLPAIILPWASKHNLRSWKENVGQTVKT